MTDDLLLARPHLDGLRTTCRALADRFAARAADHDLHGTSPRADFDDLRAAGFFGAMIPSDLGGMGLGYLQWAVAAEEFAQGSASTALAFNMHVAILGMLANGPLPQDQRRALADLVLGGGALVCVLLSEAQHAGARYATRTCRVELRHDGTVHGAKSFASMADVADYALVVARPEDGPPAAAVPVLVDMHGPGVAIEAVWDSLGMRATRSDRVTFDAAPAVEVFSTLAVEDLPAWMAAVEAPLSLPYTAVYLGVGVAALKAAAASAVARVPTGESPSPAVCRRIAVMRAQLDAARALVHQTARLVDAGTDALESMLAAKYTVGEAVAHATRSALEIGGAHAVTRGSTIERLFRDGATASIQHPPSDLCLERLGALELRSEPTTPH
ncbi:MAG: acyl-CoA dehydrogenase family protein [Sporichthyaceae bacterium]